jgi:predicted metal-dependent enzyme (double-stranded beta helix superfamily)
MSNDEYVLDTPRVRQFIAQVRAKLTGDPPAAALEALRPAFADLLADQAWLPEDYQQPSATGGMGSGIATWLIYRAAEGDLSLFSLVVPPGVSTTIHDHLAWGLVGLYAGEQDEVVYQQRTGDQADQPDARLAAVERNHLRPGDFYALTPPLGDIHSVTTTSPVASVSLHLLGNDTGCVWRHTYSLNDGAVHPFRSGWSNVPCREET